MLKKLLTPLLILLSAYTINAQTIALSSPYQITAQGIGQSAADQPISAFQAAVTVSSATLNTVSITNTGTYVVTPSNNTDLINFKLWYSSTFSFASASQIGSTVTTIPAASSAVTFSSLTQSISSGATGYFWITISVAANGSSTIGHTVIPGIPALTFASGSPTTTISASGTQTIGQNYFWNGSNSTALSAIWYTPAASAWSSPTQTTTLQAWPSSGATNVVNLVGSGGGTVSLSNTPAAVPSNVIIGNSAYTIAETALAGGNATIASNIYLGNNTLSLTELNSNNKLKLSGVISGSGGLTILSSSNEVDLTGTANSYTGTTLIQGNALIPTADGSLGAVPVSPVANSIIIDGGRLTIASTINANRGMQISSNANSSISVTGSGTATYGGIIADYPGHTPGQWAKQGGGTLILGGASTYTGVTSLNNGPTKISVANALPNTTVLYIGQASSANTASFDMQGNSQALAGLFSNTGASSSGTNTLTSSSGTPTLTIQGSGVYSYGDNGNANYSGVITGSTALTVNMSAGGSQILGGSNTYTGTTTVSGGTLVVYAGSGSGGGGLTASNVSVSAGADTLAGNGTIAGTVSISGTVSPGYNATFGSGSYSTAKLTTGAETWNTGANYKFNINGNANVTSGTPGTDWDVLYTTSTVNFASSPTISVDLSGTPTSFSATTYYMWPIIVATGGITNFNTATINLLTTNFGSTTNGTFSVVLSTNHDTIDIVYTPAGCSIPTDVTGFTGCGTTTSQTAALSWALGSCSDNVLVVATSNASVTSVPTGTTFSAGGGAYGSGTTSSNGIASGEYVVYFGSGSSATVSGLTNGTTYQFKAFAVRNTTWSTGVTASATPVATAQYFWNGGSISANPANGGSGIWSTANAWREPSANGCQSSFSDSYTDVFAGTAGTVTVDANHSAPEYDFNTTGYIITAGTSSSAPSLGGNLVLANGVNLTVNDPTQAGTNGRTLIYTGSSITGGTGSTITVGGAQGGNTGSTNTNNNSYSWFELEPTSAAFTTTVPFIMNGTGHGYVALAYNGGATGTCILSGGVQIANTNVDTVVLGGTAGYSLEVNGITAASGNTSSVLLSNKPAGTGSGIFIFEGTSNYHGTTFLSLNTAGSVKCIGDNSLSPNSLLAFGSPTTGGQGPTLDLAGTNQSIAGLASINSATGVITNTGTTGTDLLTVNQSATTTFGLPINDGTSGATTALTLSGSGKLSLTGTNTYTGATTVSGTSTLFVNGSLASGSAVSVGLGATLGGSGTVSGTVALNNGSILSPGTTGSGAVGELITGAVTFGSGTGFSETYTVDVTNATGGNGVGWDLISTGSTITLPTAGTVVLNVNGSGISNFSNSNSYNWQIMYANGGISNFNASNFTLNLSGFPAHTGSFTVTSPNSNEVDVTYTPITPTLSANPSSLSGFSTTYGIASASQSYVLSGSNLDGSGITITAPTGYEICLTIGGTYASSLTLNPGTPASYVTATSPYYTLNNTTIYVRISASNTNTNNVNGTVGNSGGSSSNSPTVTLTGTSIGPFYWNGANHTSGTTTASGGTGRWDDNNAWVSPIHNSGTGTGWTDGYIAYLGDVAGTVSLYQNESPSNTTVNTDGYVITPNNSTAETLGGTITLASSVNLTLNDPTEGGNNGRTLIYSGSGITGGTGSTITVGGAQGGGNGASNNTNYSWLELQPAGSVFSTSVPFIMNGTGAGYVALGYNGGTVGTITLAGGVQIASTNVDTIVLGGTVGFTLKVTGITPNSGNPTNPSPVMISNKATGSGKGTFIFAGNSTYYGTTFLATGLGAPVQCNGTNSLSPNSVITFGSPNASGEGPNLDLAGANQTIAGLTNLTSPASTGEIVTSGTSGTSTLTVNQAINTTYSLRIIDSTTGGKVALTKSGPGTLKLTGVNTFTGGVTLNAGALYINNASGLATGCAVTTASGAGTIGGSGKAAGTLSLSDTISPGSSGSGSFGNFTTGNQTWHSGAVYTLDLGALPTGTAGTNWDLVTSTGSITIGSGSYTVNVNGTGISSFSNTTHYIWKIATGTSISINSGASFTVNVSNLSGYTAIGTFSVVADANGTDIDLVYLPPLQGSLTTSTSSFCGSGTGQLVWTATAGTGPYVVVYSDGSGTNRTANSVASGTAFNVFTEPVTSSTNYTLVSVTDSTTTTVRTSGFTTNAASIAVTQPSTAPTSITATGNVTTLCSGSGTTLTANGGTLGTGASYVWGTGSVVGSNVISGQTSATLVLTNLTASTDYWVSVTGTAAVCGDPSGSATLNITVNQPSTAPTSITATSNVTTLCNGSGTTLTANGGSLGTGANYVWGTGTAGSNVIGGETNSTLVLTNLTATTIYWVSVTGTTAPCTNPSGSAHLIITVDQPSIAPTSITATGSVTTLCSGSGTTLTANGGTLGTGASYVWGTGTTIGSNVISGHISATLAVTNLTAATDYWVSVTGTAAACGDPTGSSTLSLSVTEPSIAPTSITATGNVTTLCNGSGTTLTANGGTLGTGANYVWGTGSVVGSNVISGETNSTLNLTNLTATTIYWVSVTGTTAPCTDPTGSAHLTITIDQPSTTPTSITATGNSTTLCKGSGTTLTANGGTLGTGARYVWGTGTIVGSNVISGQSAATLVLTNLTASTSYWVSVTGTAAACGDPAGSATLAISVNQPSTAPTSITATGNVTTLCYGLGTTLTANGGILGTGASYVWGTGTVGSNIISGATGSTLVLTNLTANTTYWVSVTGTVAPCTDPVGSATKAINITPNNSINLSSATGTNSQTVCINTAITHITYTTISATGATFSGLPTGVTGSWASNTVTISGTPTVSGNFSYTVTLTGGCGTASAPGTISVTPKNTITFSSASGTNAQTFCLNGTIPTIKNITYTTTGATGASFSGLPPGVIGSWASNTVTISGTPTVPGTYSYVVTLTGGCGVVTASGTIYVNSACINNWTGAVSTVWATPGNWTVAVPTSTIDGIIPNTTLKPVISAAASARNLTLLSGASLTISTGQTLQLYGNLTNSGVASFGPGTMQLAGSTDTLFGSTAFANLTLSGNAIVGPGTGDKISVSGILLKSSGSLNTNNKLTLISTSAQTALIEEGSGSIQGNATIQRYVGSTSGYHHISSPVSGATLANLLGFTISGADGVGAFIKNQEGTLEDYIESTNRTSILDSSYYNYTALSNPLTSGLGLSALIYGGYFISFYGPPTTGPLTYNITDLGSNPATAGWNFIGNPYPSPISWTELKNANSGVMDATAYIWKPSSATAGSWQAYNGGSSVGGAGDVIAEGQGFFILKNNPGTTALSFDNSMRYYSLSPVFYKTDLVPDEIRLTLTEGVDTAEILSYTQRGASKGYDPDIDGPMPPAISGTNANNFAFVSEGRKYLINVFDNITDGLEIPLAIHAANAGNYTIGAGALNVDKYPVFLLDKETNTYFDLAAQNVTFTSQGNEDKSNYSIVFKKDVFAPANNVNIYGKTGAIVVEQAAGNIPVSIRVTNILGQEIFKTTTTENSVTLPIEVSAIYLVSVTQNGVETIKKVFLK